jgi:signal transduction histidine kinase
MKLDPLSLGLHSDDLSFEAEDGSYAVELSHAGGAIYDVRERGWADDASGEHLVAIFERLLDAVEALGPEARVYLCSDYSEYRGSSNATRKAMLRSVVMRDSLGAVAFWGAGFVARSVARLLNVALPRLAARPFASREEALAHLQGLSGEREAQSTPSPDGGGESMDAAVLASFLLRNTEFVRTDRIGSRERRVVRPADWCWRSSDGAASLTLALLDDDVILAQPFGPFGREGVAARQALFDRVLGDLGLQRLSLVLDLRATPPLPPELELGRVGFFRSRAESLHHLVLVGDSSLVAGAEDLLLLGASPLGERPVFSDLPQALEALDRARRARQRGALRLDLPSDRAELEALALRQHASLQLYHTSLQRLFAFVGRVTWDEGYMSDGALLPPDVAHSNPYWSLYGMVHLMQQDMLSVLREREARNRELADARERAEAANRAKSQFLGTVSHELRTPLNAIFGMVDLLRGEGLRGDQLRQLEGIHAASRQLERLVSDLLDITRIEEGVLGLQQESVALAPLLEELRLRWEAVAQRKGLELRYRVASDLPAAIRTDRGRLLQVLTNLLDNAVKFTERGWVQLRVERLEGGGLLLEVADSGRGIPTEDLPFVFERFVRGHEGRAGVMPGLGLGLAICRQVVTLMGGEIDVSSEPGRGARFEIRLPASPDEPLPLPAAPPPVEQADFSDLLVLLVEDDPPSRYVAQHLLESLGCQVVCAEDGRQALERLGGGRYDLVLMDCQMPYHDGLEVTRRFRATEPPGQRTPIVALTAYAFAEDRERVLAAGMDDHEAKPVSRARFQELLQRWAL